MRWNLKKYEVGTRKVERKFAFLPTRLDYLNSKQYGYRGTPANLYMMNMGETINPMHGS